MDGSRVCGCAGRGRGPDVHSYRGMVMSGFDRSIVYATGAYGREANRPDWLAGKDFQIQSGPYFSIRDIATIRKDGAADIVFVNRRGNVVFVENL